VDALALGALVRLVRVRKRLRQRDVARRAGLSDGVISRIEHGQLGPISHSALLRVAAVLEIRLDYRARWHAGDLDRLTSADHSLLVEHVADRLGRAGWEHRPEVSFAIWGERGAVDVLAWLPAQRALLVVEVKTEVTDVGETLRVLGVKERHAARIAASVGWLDPAAVSIALLIGDTRTNHRRVAAHSATIRAALPDTGRQLRALVGGHLDRSVRALAYVPYQRSSATRPRTAGVIRVATPRTEHRRAS
jgi:transcriptional regulator with XRE-family HTH domain